MFHARLLPAAAVVAALSAAVRGLGACRPGGEGVSGSWADLAAACGRDGGLGRLRAGSAMGWAREGGWTGGGVWRAGRAGHARGVSSNSSRTTSSSKTALGLVAESLIPAPWRCGVGSGYPRTVWSQRLHKLKTQSWTKISGSFLCQSQSKLLGGENRLGRLNCGAGQLVFRASV